MSPRDPGTLPSREQCIERAAGIAASMWRQLADAWTEGGPEAVAELVGETAAQKYEDWVAEDQAQRTAGSAA